MRAPIAARLAMSVLLTGLAGGAVQANCQGEGPYPVVQCGRSAWFAPPPAGAGAVSAVWWQVGMGNATVFNTAVSSVGADGSGFSRFPLPGIFFGNDSGALNAVDLDLVDASTSPGLGAPAGSLCFDSGASWGIPGTPGIDGCADMNRSYYRVGGATSISDNYLNIYWSTIYGPTPYFSTDSSLLDAPMGVLLKESRGFSFALAFFASENRQHDSIDVSPGRWDMGAIVNGLPGPTGNNIVPWQSVPNPFVNYICEPPACATQSLFLAWNPITIISDESTRPCFQFDVMTPCVPFAPGVIGVGVLDQGPLARYQAERATWGGAGCETDWTPIPAGLVDHPASSMLIQGIQAPFCVRLTTQFGRKPYRMPCTAATTSCRSENRDAAEAGLFGDLGYQVSSLATIIGGPLAAENVALTSATRGRGGVTVEWTTTSELSVTGFDIVALTSRGRREVLAASVACSECNTGAAASYSVAVPQWKLRGARSVRVVMRPSGVESEARAIE